MDREYTNQQQSIINGLKREGWCYLRGLGNNEVRLLAKYSGRHANTIKYRDFAEAAVMPPAATITALSLLTGIERDVFIAMGDDPRNQGEV